MVRTSPTASPFSLVTTFKVIFWHGHQQYVYFFADLYLPQDGAARVSVAMVWVTPYKLFLKVPWVNKQLASSDFIFGTRKKAADAK
jgi:hypothetical protein